MRALLCAFLAVLSTAAMAVPGFDQPGSDYDNFNADSVLVCRQTCAADSRCKAYTWVRPGVQGPSAHCWLKSRVPTLVRNDCCDSGSAQNILRPQLREEFNVNRPGADYRNFTAANYQLCQATCAQENQCAAWSWVRAGVQGPAPRCWLKSNGAHPVSDTNVTSGVKLKPRSVLID